MTNKHRPRRALLKKAALIGGGIAAVGLGLPLLIGEKKAVFESNGSYWFLEKPTASPPLEEDMNVDVAIIGGGYTGLSSAWHLAKNMPGINIIILEAGQLGSGASGRHGGMVLPQIGVESFEIGHDIETHKQLYDLTVEGMQSLQQLVDSTQIECDLQLDGYVHVFLDEEDRPYYEEYVDQAQQANLPLELWDADRLATALGTEAYVGGVYDPNGGSVHAMKLVKALKTAVEQVGVRIFGDSPVTKIEEAQTIRLSVGTANHHVRAKAIVLATNAYTSKLGYFKHQIMPVHAQTAVTAPLKQQQLESIAWETRLPFYDSRNMLYHVVLTPDDRIVIGGGNAEYCFGNDLHYCGNLGQVSDLMLNELVRIYPALQGLQFEYVWDGVLGMTFDEVPTVGLMGEHRNIYYGLAYNGQGVNLSFVFGDVIAALYQEKDHAYLHTPYAQVSPSFIPPEPYRWLGVQAAMKYYAWQDD